MWMNADEVVRFGIDSVMQQPPLVVAIPGRVNRSIASMFKLLPRKLGDYMIRRESGKYREE
jgi:predicted ATP-grasp superfamily ATP-dependent carboligase